MRPKYLADIALTIMGLGVTGNAALAQECPKVAPDTTNPAAIVLDHETGVVEYRGRVISDGDELRIHTSGRVDIEIENSNSALYDLELTAERIAAPEIGFLTSFAADLNSYIPEFGEALATREVDDIPKGVQQLQEKRASVKKSLSEIYGNISRPGGLQDAEMTALETLRSMNIHCPPWNSRGTLQRFLEKDPLKKDRLTAVRRLGQSLDTLRAHNSDLLDALENARPDSVTHPEAYNGAIQVAEAARKVLDTSDDLYAAALETERLVIDAVEASPSLRDSTRVSLAEGRELTISVTPKDDKRRLPLAELEPRELKLKVFREWPIRPTVGVGVLSSPDATFPIFNTAPAPPDSVVIVSSGEQDSRVQWGVTLGLTMPRIGIDKIKGTQWTIWPIEFTVNPTSDVRSYGFGSAVSWWFMKFGFGRLHTRRTNLDDQTEGDMLPNAESLRTKKEYTGKYYVSLSIAGWPRP